MRWCQCMAPTIIHQRSMWWLPHGRAAVAGAGIRKGLQAQFGIRRVRQPDADDQALAYVNDDGDMHHASAGAQLGQVAGPYAFGRSRHVPLEQVGRRHRAAAWCSCADWATASANPVRPSPCRPSCASSGNAALGWSSCPSATVLYV